VAYAGIAGVRKLGRSSEAQTFFVPLYFQALWMRARPAWHDRSPFRRALCPLKKLF
jgi:hypothetical protein